MRKALAWCAFGVMLADFSGFMPDPSGQGWSALAVWLLAVRAVFFEERKPNG